MPLAPDDPTWRNLYAALAGLAVGCGGRTGPTDGADAGVEAEATIDAPSPARSCATDDDCIAVLDYRDGFTCYLPSAASKADVGRDSCLIPWTPKAVCTTPPPPAGCPYSGAIPVQHSCFNIPCALPTCNEGTCAITVGFGSQCPVIDAGPPDCAALLAAYLQAIAAGQECDPAQDASICAGEYPDSCGCEAPYNLLGRQAVALQCAFDNLTTAHCATSFCGRRCPAPPSTGAAACVPSASGARGTCAWVQ